MVFKSKKTGMILLALATVGSMVFAGCSSKAPANNSTVVEEESKSENNENNEFSMVPVVENESEVAPLPATEEQPLATITITWVCSDGEMGLLEDSVVITPLRADALAERYCNYYDENDVLVYTWSRDYEEDENGVKIATAFYQFYTLDYDFDLFVEPLVPENTEDLQTIEAVIDQPGMESITYKYEDIGRRGQTGIWYAGVCACRGGAITEYVAE